MTLPRLTRADGLALQILAAQELARRPEGTLADWTLGHRRMRGAPLQLPPAQRDLHADPHPFIVIQKAAQVGISEYLINTALWAAACVHGGRGTAIYFMPTESGIRDFVAARVEPAIAQSPTLAALVGRQGDGERGPDSGQLKRVGDGYIYFRGADSPRQLQSVDSDVVILDDYDRMPPGGLALALVLGSGGPHGGCGVDRLDRVRLRDIVVPRGGGGDLGCRVVRRLAGDGS